MNEVGKNIWAIPEGYIPPRSTGPEPGMNYHETACMLNAGDEDAHIEINICFLEKEPIGPYRWVVPAGSIQQARFNELEDPEPVHAGTDYVSLFFQSCRR